MPQTLSPFPDKTRPPTDDDVRSILGVAYDAWAKLVASVADRLRPIDEVWGFTSARTGWGLRLRHKDRVILYMTPQPNQFLVSFALGEKAVAAANAARLPGTVLNAIRDAPRYAEGRGVRITVKSSRQVPALATLARIKSEN